MVSWLLLGSGCRGPTPCVEVSSSDRAGVAIRNYDEFTQVTSISSDFLFTPDQEWTLAEQRDDGLIHWSIQMWLRGSSASPYIDVSLRMTCLAPAPEGESSCVNCDDLCNNENGRLEVLADGRPLALPASRYRRMPTDPPTPESPATWASTIHMPVESAALWPLEQARNIKLRACGALVATLTAAESANLQDFLRHHRAIAPAR
jgi:hypothetical protein